MCTSDKCICIKLCCVASSLVNAALTILNVEHVELANLASTYLAFASVALAHLALAKLTQANPHLANFAFGNVVSVFWGA